MKTVAISVKKMDYSGVRESHFDEDACALLSRIEGAEHVSAMDRGDGYTRFEITTTAEPMTIMFGSMFKFVRHGHRSH